MLKVIDKEYIRKLYYVEGWSIRKISKTLGHARPTIRKMLQDAEIPKYRLSQPRPYPVMDPYKEVIAHWIEEDRHAPNKQQHTAIRIYHRLVDEYGFAGGASTVRRYVAQLKQSVPECSIPLEAAPGEQAQVDFGQAQVEINHELVQVHLFCLRMKYSQVPFVMAFPTEKLEAFLEGHVQAFEYLGGVPAQALYDNAKTQVVKILEGPFREEHEKLSSLRAHYLFKTEFCRPGKGNEKGSVENLVGYVRRNALVPVPSFSSWEELNAHLRTWCEKERIRHQKQWEAEQAALRSLPSHPFSSATVKPVKVNTYALVNFDRNRYSVPSRYVGRTLNVRGFVNRVEVLDGEQVVATHARHYGRGQVSLQFEHYLSILERKPHAVTHATVVRQLPPIFQQLRQRMSEAKKDGYKDFLQVLLLARPYPLAWIEEALVTIGAARADAHLIEEWILAQHRPNQTDTPSSVHLPNSIAEVHLDPTDPAQYEILLQEVAAG